MVPKCSRPCPFDSMPQLQNAPMPDAEYHLPPSQANRHRSIRAYLLVLSEVHSTYQTNHLQEALTQACDKDGGFRIPDTLACSVDFSKPVLKQQALYSVYVHSSRYNFTDFPADHLFAGTLIPEVSLLTPQMRLSRLGLDQRGIY